MKRRVVSIITVMALCLSLCPTQALAADWEPDTGLCSHHPVHTEECGYVPPTPGRDCTHEHDESCFITETQCVHQHTEECYPEPGPDFDPELEELESTLCTHVCSEDSGCVTLTPDCHHVHDESCGYIPEDAGAPCTFVCRICPIEDLIDMLPRSVTPDNRSQVEERLREVLALYTELTGGEQEQLDLSRCLDLQIQLDAANAPMLLDTTGVAFKQEYWINKDTSLTGSYLVDAAKSPLWFDANGFEFSVSNGSALIVQSTYTMYIKSQTDGTGGGAITSKKGAGVEVQSGSVLRVEDPNVVITGTTYGLDVASGADVQLSGGTFTGRTAAIRTADDDFGALLEKGYAYFDTSGNPILLANVASALTVVVKECTDHVYNYTHTSGATTHKWVCDICGAEGTEKCTFDFDADGAAACVCGNQIKIAINPDKIYNGAAQSVGLTVTLQDGSNKVLTENTDYKVEYVPRVDVGEITVTVTGITYDGTFTTTCSVIQDQPVISWYNPVCDVDYDGSPVDASDLPRLTISTLSSEDLSGNIQYSYRKADGTGGTDFIDGLPTNAGTYEIKASLPEQLNYKAAETSPCLTLTIRKIPARLTAPAATQPDYNRAAQELVTAGSVRDGAVIEFKLGTNGSYSTDIPTGINAGEYDVWYRVADTENYTGDPETKILNVRIQPKEITPKVDLSATSYVYDSSKKEPTIKVRDGQIEIEDDQYTVSWDNDLTSAGTHTATIASTNKNYTFASVTASVEIVAATQGALSITGAPSRVCYGDTVTTLSTSGGTGNGSVTWSITTSGVSSTIHPTTGVLTVRDVGTITVKAVREVDNYQDAEATYDITIEPKTVMADVTVADKEYNGTNAATVTKAEIKDLLAGDVVTVDITSLTATFSDVNAGANKTVTLDSTHASVNGVAAYKYTVTYPSTTIAAITQKAVSTPSITLSGNDLKTDASGDYYEFDGTEKRPTVTLLDGTEVIPSSNYTVVYSNNKNVGTTATVTVTANTDGNYTFPETSKTFEIRKAAAVLTSTPLAKDLTYTGNLQDLVTVGTADGGTVVYSSSQNGSYSETIPQGDVAKTYTVYYMVEGDDNHIGSATPSRVDVTIKPKEFTPAITLNPSTPFSYDGFAKMPAVTVKDGNDVIDAAEYTVSYSNNINAGTATVTVSDKNGGNYIVNGTANFEIAKANPTFTPPTGKMSLSYNGAGQELISRGSSPDGTMVYSLDGANYSEAVPTGNMVDNYTIYYKVLGDSNHNDSASDTVSAAIGTNTVTRPTITLSADTFRYNGNQQVPTIKIRDDNGNLIPESDYTVTYAGTNGNKSMVDVDTYTITIKNKNSNYSINATSTFKIVAADQEVLSITGTRDQVYYGDTIQLGTDGGTGNGTVAWSITGNTDTTIDPSSGLLIVKDVGSSITVTAERTSSDNYSKISTTWVFYASRKPVTAVLTGVSKVFDNSVSATVKAEVDPRDWVSGDSISIDDLDGDFEDPNVGENKKITITTSSPTVSGTNWDKYDITYPSTATASITPADAEVSVKPQAATLTYDAGNAQELVTPGSATGGTMVYSLDGVAFSRNIPTAQDADTYTVYYKVQGNNNYNDSDVFTVPVEIEKQTVDPHIELVPPSAMYDGNVKRPGVIIRDDAGHVIPENEYKVTYDPGTDWKSARSHTVIIENISGGNYVVDNSTAIFTISTSESSPLTIIDKPGFVYYGDSPFTLSAIGGSGQGAITWKSSDDSIAEVDSSSGLVTIKDVGTVTITAEKAATANYDSSSATYSFTVQKKPVTAVVTAEDKVYNGDDIAQIHVTLPGLVGNDSIDTTGLSGKFEDKNAGTDKMVTVTGTLVSAKYDITIPSTTASILKATPSVDPYPTASSITSGQTLRDSVLSGGAASVDGSADGSLDGSFDWEDGTIEPEAGTAEYAVIFAPDDTVNYNTVTIQVSVTVTEPSIDPTPGNGSDGDSNDGDGTDGDNTGGDDADSSNTGSSNTGSSNTGSSNTGSSNTGSGDTGNNDNTGGGNSISDDMGTNFITLPSGTPSLSQPSAVSAPEQTSVQNGTATTVLSATDGDKLVSEAIANQSTNVVIKPEITGRVTKTEVSIPVSTVSQLKSETNANLTVSTPIADVTIPNAALGTLSSAGGDVSVVTEQVENTVTLTLTAGGENIESVPGGLTLTVPVEDAGPGTVAVLVHEDGTRETIRKSIAENGAINIPLDGSATVEIVDNSKEFVDVPVDSWAADAVAFASAHELFNGTGETTFSPELPMSRAMLATVLYNLEGSPAQSLTNEFSDVGSDDWYAAGVSWAAANGITNGYGDGQFGPNDSITREQFAVMLWKYAGCPAADGQALNFTDADQISSYAIEALCWATASGILSGYGDGQLDPSGLATRAQAAKMLQNFMEGL